MKYMIVELINTRSVVTTPDGIAQTSFFAEVGNPNYDQFLVDAKLTDKKVKALEPDVWFDFPVDGGTN